MKKIAIIPARGGSKRIPRKNIKHFLDKPIISYAIDLALSSGYFDEVMVSTDDLEIAKIAKKYGANVPFYRSELNSNDYATTFDVLKEVIGQYEKENIYFDIACCIYPCTPLIQSQTFSKIHNKLINNDFDTVFPVVRYSTPIQRAVRLQDDIMSMMSPEFIHTRSQDLEPAFFDAGQFYWFKTKIIKTTNSLWTDNTSCLEIDEMQAQDIDNEMDWKLAEIKYKMLNSD